VDRAKTGSGFRLTELVAAISLATDLGTGQPLEHALGTWRLSMVVADVLGVDSGTMGDVHHVALLRFLGCTADAPETARLAGGDNIAFNAAMAPVLMGGGEAVAALFREVGRGRPAAARVRLLGEALGDPHGRSLVGHCEVGARLAARLGLGDGVVQALSCAYERWDGRGPRRVSGEGIPLPVRVVVVARDAVLWRRMAGPEVAQQVLARRRGRAYDPAVVDAVRAVGGPGDGGGPQWQDVLAGEPEPVRWVGPSALDAALTAVGDFADLRSVWTRGRSSRLADTAAAAGTACGLGPSDVTMVRRAALVSDLGAVGVPSGVWEQPGPLGVDAVERLRLHPYLTERILSRCAGLRPVAALAGAHHERLDGSGYHRGSGGVELSRAARVLAAADVWTGLGQDRPHRPALPSARACEVLRAEAADGRLDGVAVEAVLAAAGQGARRPSWPAGLSEREVQVLRLIARGTSNRDVARRLGISTKTVGHHVAHIYTKIGVTTRPAAALFAMERGLLAE
jgi:HD-GYP domain-containing protein (c-di-GMP phosphodiesterase class II)